MRPTTKFTKETNYTSKKNTSEIKFKIFTFLDAPVANYLKIVVTSHAPALLILNASKIWIFGQQITTCFKLFLTEMKKILNYVTP